MAQQRPITPEKQLLNVIESSTDKSGVQAQAVKHRSLSLFSFGAWVGRISFFKGAYKKRFRGKKLYHLDVRLANKILVLFVFVLAVYFIGDFYGSLTNLKKMSYLEFERQKGAGLAGAQEPLVLKKSASYYLEKAREKNIFKMGQKKPIPKKTKGKKATSSGEPSPSIIETTQHLKLVGISWSNEPDVMIEDTKAFRTFFVRRGQMIGKIKVQAIFKDKVVLSCDGEEIELK